MPQFILLAAIGTAAYIGYKMIKRGMTFQGFNQTPVRVKSVYLERGPDGVFRPVERISSDRI